MISQQGPVVKPSNDAYIAVLHANAEEDAQKTMEQIKGRFSPEKLVVSTLSPVVGTHTGPGAIAVTFVTE